MRLKQVPRSDLDYIEIYAQELKENPKLFEQQKDFIESQLSISSELAQKRFPKGEFKAHARAHLKDIGLL